MITEQEIEEIRNILKKAKKPLFFFDDDPDGLCSYLLLRKYTGVGKGVMVKSAPEIPPSYARKIREYHPDLVVILDKPMASEEFLEEAGNNILWIDHHDPQNHEKVKYYNPRIHDDKDNRPVSYWSYIITQEHLWIAMTGIVGDWFLPEFTKDFMDKYPNLLNEVKEPGEALYGDSPFGTLTKIFAFLLKGPTAQVNRNIRTLEKVESPYEILEQQTPKGKLIYKEYEKINKEYEKILKKAKEHITNDKILFFMYPSQKMSFTGNLANELLHLYPDKVIIIGRDKGERIIMSLRSKNHEISAKLKQAIEGLDGYGGGHLHACGGNLSKADFNIFLERFKKMF